MVGCGATLSWDGILCRRCRNVFDNVIARNDRPLREDMFTMLRTYWWHDMGEMERCSRRSCSLCSMVLLAMKRSRSQELQPLDLEDKEFPVWYRVGGRAPATYELSFFAPFEGVPADGKLPPGTGNWIEDIHIRFCSDVDRRGQPILGGNDTASPATYNKIRRWLSICENHSICQSWRLVNHAPKILPHRLLEIEQSEKHPRIRLVTTEHWQALETPYLTLSHCWGGKSPLKLLQSNMQDYQSQIPWTDMPQTFKDAILVTKCLGFMYLWIDALCIIQNSKDDWAKESASMTTVYANSFLNISADDAANGDDGLFRDRNLSGPSPFFVDSSKTDASGRYVCYVNGWEYDITDAPLNHRGWVIQERFLAPRVLHYARGQVYWECQCLMTAESLPDEFDVEVSAEHMAFKKLSTAKITSVSQRTNVRDIYELWYRLVERYSTSGLTIPSDRSVAIAGLARAFSNIIGTVPEDYVCGMWRPNFIAELSWNCPPYIEGYSSGLGQRDALLSPACKVPSWSWLSIDRGIAITGWKYHMIREKELVELVKVHTFPTGDPFGVVCGGYVTVKGHLGEARLSWPSSPGNAEARIYNPASVRLSHATLGERNSFSLFPDNVSEGAVHELSNKPVYLMLCSTDKTDLELSAVQDDGSESDFSEDSTHRPAKLNVDSVQSEPNERDELPSFTGHTYRCLILVPTGTAATFQRVGIIVFASKAGDHYIGEQTRISKSQSRAMWISDRAVLEQGLRSPDIPPELYEAVDEQLMYTFTIV